VIDLPICEPAAAAALTQLATRLPAAFSIAGIPVAAAMPGRLPPQLPGHYRRLDARLDGRTIRVTIDPLLLPPAAIANWPEITALPAEDALRDILFDLVLRDLALQVEGWCGRRPDWSACGSEEGLPYAILLNRLDADDAAIGRVELDIGGLGWLAAQCAQLPVHLASVEDLPIGLPLRLAGFALSAAELRVLAAGDVVLLDDDPVDRDGILTILLPVAGGLTFRATIEAGRLSLVSVVDCAMSEPDALPPTSLDDMSLPVDLNVGRLSLPLGRLRELAVGQVLDLGFDATTNVSLAVNGQVIAIGELVRLAERTGVRILELRLARGEP
jgi:type III secretion protein Q